VDIFGSCGGRSSWRHAPGFPLRPKTQVVAAGKSPAKKVRWAIRDRHRIWTLILGGSNSSKKFGDKQSNGDACM
jgi:hypothetical protein